MSADGQDSERNDRELERIRRELDREYAAQVQDLEAAPEKPPARPALREAERREAERRVAERREAERRDAERWAAEWREPESSAGRRVRRPRAGARRTAGIIIAMFLLGCAVGAAAGSALTVLALSRGVTVGSSHP